MYVRAMAGDCPRPWLRETCPLGARPLLRGLAWVRLLVAADRLVGGAAAEQLLEERAVMDEGLPQILRGRLAALVRRPDPVRRPIVLDDVRMVDGDRVGTRIEVVDRIAAVAHHLLDEMVRLGDGLGRRVDEAHLHRAPLL